MELKFYISIIVRCLVIVDSLSESIQYFQWNTLNQSEMFLQTNYLQTTTIFNNNMIFKQKESNLQYQPNIYSPLCIPPQTHNIEPVVRSINLLNPPKLLHLHHHLRQNISLKTQPKPCLKNRMKHLIDLMKYLADKMNIWIILNMNWCTHQKIPKCPKKQQTSLFKAIWRRNSSLFDYNLLWNTPLKRWASTTNWP